METVMQKRIETLIILIMIAFLWSSCMNQSPQQNGQRHQPNTVTQLRPAVAIPGECPITPVYFGQSANDSSLSGIPWIEIHASSSKIKAYLFFAGPISSNTPTYQLLHTGGSYLDGKSTKIMWVIDDPHASDTVIIIGRKLLSSNGTFQQSFPMASSPIGTYPSTVNVPTPGCWLLQVKSGSTTANATFWVVGD